MQKQINTSTDQSNHTERNGGLLRKLANWIEKQNIDPKTWVIIMFIIIFATVIFQTTWMFVAPKEVVIKEVPAEEVKAPLMQGFKQPNRLESVEYKEVAERAQRARMLLNSGVPLTKSDSLYISDTYDMINKFNNQSKP